MIKRVQDRLSLQHVLIVLAVIIVYIIFQTQVDAETLNFTLDVSATRPPLRVLAIALSGFAFWGIISALIEFNRHRGWILWHTTVRQVGWRLMVIAQVVVILFILKPDLLGFQSTTDSLSIIQGIVPLIIAMQTAAIFAPDDEPALEVQLAAPRPLSWLICERLLVVFLLYGVFTTVIGMGVIGFQNLDTNAWMLVVRWLPAALFLSGFGIFVTMQSRLVAFGVIFIGFAWILFGLFGDFLLQGGMYPFPLNMLQPFLWAFNIFATPETFEVSGDFWLNRFILSGTGLSLMILAVWQVRDEESVLLNLSRRQRRKSPEKVLQKRAVAVHAEHDSAGIQVTDISVNPLWQIVGITWYEMKMHWRRRSLKVFTLTLFLFNVFIVAVMANNIASVMPDEIATQMVQPGRLVNGLLLVLFITGPYVTVVLFMFPLMMAEVVPLDKQYHVAELLNALPFSHIVYLTGKLMGAFLAGFMSFGGAIVVLAIGWYLRAGAFNPVFLLNITLVSFLLMLINTALAVLIGSTQTTRLRAIVALIVAAVVGIVLSGLLDNSLVNILFPDQIALIPLYINGAIDGLSTTPPHLPQISLVEPPLRTLIMGGLIQIGLVMLLIVGWHAVKEIKYNRSKRGDR